MNKENYKAAFSHVHPSAQAIERIMDMKNNKSKKRVVAKTLIALAAVISLLVVGGIVANAATDGKVAENAKTVISKLTSFPVRVTENGKPVDESEYSTELNEENGKSVLKVKTKHGELVCETPYDEYEKLDSGDVYSEAIGVDENGNTFKEIVVVGNGTNEPTTAKAE